jgi:hypothetical protein
MRYETVWQKNQAKIEANFNKKIASLEQQVRDQITEVGLHQNLCLSHRAIFREILAICAQEQMLYLEPEEKLERIEQYVRRALVAK